MIDCHLLGKVFLQPLVIIHMVMDETECVLKLNLHGSLTDLTVVEPSLGEPSDSCLVTIDADETRDVKALNIYIKRGKRIYELTVNYRLGLYFFFTSSLMPGRNMPCCNAI